MFSILVLICVCIVTYKMAEMGNRNGAVWATASFGVMIGVAQITGGLLAGIVTLVLMIIAMTVANCINDPSMS